MQMKRAFLNFFEFFFIFLSPKTAKIAKFVASGVFEKQNAAVLHENTHRGVSTYSRFRFSELQTKCTSERIGDAVGDKQRIAGRQTCSRLMTAGQQDAIGAD